MLVSARADEIQRPAVARRTVGHQAAQFHFTDRGRHTQCAGAQFGGDFIEQVVDGFRADHLEHACDVIGGVRNECHVADSLFGLVRQKFCVFRGAHERGLLGR